jgi:hypothetical protein
VRLRFFTVLLTVALFLGFTAPHAHSVSAHGCASPIPPSVPGSPTPAPAIPGSVLINEVLYIPGSNWNCSEQNGAFSSSKDSWVELYNPQNHPFNLYAAHAGLDTGPGTLTYYLPFGTAIAAHGFLVLFPAVYSDILSAGAHLRLVIAGVVLDQVTISVLSIDQSYARIPEGSSSWQITNTPTIDASNTPSQIIPTPTTTSPVQGSGSGSNGSTSSSSKPAHATGTQPAWDKLQFPTPGLPSTPVVGSTLSTSPASSTPVSNGWDIPRRILLTTLAVALVLTLYCCWRLFSTH